jgi:peptide/nickel transport system ATP-binding protein
MDADRSAQLTPIPGMPPDLSQLPSGCPFRPRCARAVARCEQVYPELLEIGPDHRARCLRLDEEGAP